MKKKILACILATLMVATVFTGCGGSSNGGGSAEGGAAEYTWKMALNSTEGDNAYDIGAAFKEKIEELTDGRVQVDLYGGAQLGSTVEVLEGMSVGVADVMVESVGTLAPFTELANIDIMPYLYQDYDHFMKVWSSELGTEMKEAIGEATGFKLIGGAYRSPRITTATKPMSQIEDFKGFKLRSPSYDGYMKTWQWFGAAPTPMPIGETYTNLQQGVVEGQENPMVDSINYGFDEVCDYWIKTNHIYSCNLVIMDRNYFNGLPEDIQAAVEEASAYACTQISEAQAEKDAAAEEQLIADGKTIIEVDIDAFTKHFEGFVDANYPALKDWADQIAAMAE